MTTQPASFADAHPDRAHRAKETARLLEASADATGLAERKRLLDEVVVLNIPLADSVASRYRNRGIDLDDLSAVARLALVKAVHRFDPTLGSDFADFATPTIRGEVRRHFRDHGWVVRPPRRIQEMQAAITATQETLNSQLGQSARPTQLAEALGADVSDVEEALAAHGCFTPTSLDLPVGDGAGTSLADLLGHDDSSFGAAEARTVLGPLLRRLSARDRRVLDLRFSQGRTQTEIAADLGVTQMQVSRLIRRILRDLRADLSPDNAASQRSTVASAATRVSRPTRRGSTPRGLGQSSGTAAAPPRPGARISNVTVIATPR